MAVHRPLLAALLLGFACLGHAACAQGGPSGPGFANPVAGHFRLAAPDGSTVDSDDLAGKPYVLFFGFTHCPDVCPTTLAELTLAMAKLPASARDLKAYFVTIDPERDTPEVLGRYMDSFDPRIVGLSGQRGDVDEAIRSFGIVARRTELPAGGYVFGHTAALFLVDGDGVIVDRVGAGLGPDALTARLATLAAGVNSAAAPTR